MCHLCQLFVIILKPHTESILCTLFEGSGCVSSQNKPECFSELCSPVWTFVHFVHLFLLLKITVQAIGTLDSNVQLFSLCFLNAMLLLTARGEPQHSNE